MGEKMQNKFTDDMVPISPTPIKSGDKKGKVKYSSPFEEINRVKKMHPGAKRICRSCNTPIYDEGKCPNCGDWYLVH